MQVHGGTGEGQTMSKNKYAKQDAERELPDFSELGTTGLRRFSGYIDEEFHKDLRGQKAAKVYREMVDNHPIIGAVLHLIDLLIRQTVLNVEASGEGPEYERAQQLCESAIDDIDIRAVISEAQTMMPFGYAVLEKVFKVRRGNHPMLELRSSYDDGLIGWRKLAIRAQEAVERWEFGEHGEVLGVYHRAPPSYKLIYIPAAKMLHFALRKPKGNPEGKSLLRNAYVPYYFQKQHQFFEGIGAERNLAGVPDMQVPLALFDTANVEKLQTFKDMVRKIKADQYGGIVRPAELDTQGMPTGYKFGLVSASGRNLPDSDLPIKRNRAEIAMVLLAEFMIFGTEQSGSRALSVDKTEMFTLVVGGILDAILEPFTQDAFPELCELNGIDSKYAPTYQHGDIETPNVQALAAALGTFADRGIIVPDAGLEAHLRELLGLPAPEREAAINAPSLAPAANDDAESSPLLDGAPPANDDKIADAALNGAQVTALKDIITSVAAGELPRDSALEIVMLAFQLQRDAADRILGSAGRGFEATQAVA
jgi:hypothetical protein